MNTILDIVRAILDIPISYSNVFGNGKMSEAFLGFCGLFSSIIACYLAWGQNPNLSFK